jgi:hypothetical protein
MLFQRPMSSLKIGKTLFDAQMRLKESLNNVSTRKRQQEKYEAAARLAAEREREKEEEKRRQRLEELENLVRHY